MIGKLFIYLKNILVEFEKELKNQIEIWKQQKKKKN